MFAKFSLINKIKIITAMIWSACMSAAAPVIIGLSIMSIRESFISTDTDNVFVWVGVFGIIIWGILQIPALVWVCKKMYKAKPGKIVIPLSICFVSLVISSIIMFI